MMTEQEPKGRWRTKVEEGIVWRMSEIHCMRRWKLAAMGNTEPMIGYELGILEGVLHCFFVAKNKNETRVAEKSNKETNVSGSIWYVRYFNDDLFFTRKSQ